MNTRQYCGRTEVANTPLQRHQTRHSSPMCVGGDISRRRAACCTACIRTHARITQPGASDVRHVDRLRPGVFHFVRRVGRQLRAPTRLGLLGRLGIAGRVPPLPLEALQQSRITSSFSTASGSAALQADEPDQQHLVLCWCLPRHQAARLQPSMRSLQSAQCKQR